MKKLRVGTRGSVLARRQTSWVVSRIKEAYPDVAVEEIVITTRGDRNTQVPLPKIGDKGLFTRELETALLSGEIDFAVHSLKDLPTEIPDGLCIGAVPPRAIPLDAVVAPGGLRLEDLPEGARLGTSSLRRTAQIRLLRPDLIFVDIRGNLDTRLRKLGEGLVDALVLAAAGLERLGLDVSYEPISLDVCLPAPGQGALAVEIRSDDCLMQEICRNALEDPASRQEVEAERAFLQGLGGGCQIPVGALARVEGRMLYLQGIVVQPDGRRYLKDGITGEPERALELGEKLAVSLMKKGAKEILESGN